MLLPIQTESDNYCFGIEIVLKKNIASHRTHFDIAVKNVALSGQSYKIGH